MQKFELINGYYIKNIDGLNYAISKDVVSKDGVERTDYHGYFPDLPSAFRGSVKMLSLQAGTNQELEEIVTRLEKLQQSL